MNRFTEFREYLNFHVVFPLLTSFEQIKTEISWSFALMAKWLLILVHGNRKQPSNQRANKINVRPSFPTENKTALKKWIRFYWMLFQQCTHIWIRRLLFLWTNKRYVDSFMGTYLLKEREREDITETHRNEHFRSLLPLLCVPSWI